MEKDKKTKTKQPNVLLLVTDQQRADCLGALGHPVVKTPNLDKLAGEGVLFKNTFTTSVMCGPSRACLDTGRYIHANRSTQNEVSLPIDEKTMGNHFTEAGYRTACMGKNYYVKDYFFSDPDAKAPVHDYEWYTSTSPGWGDYCFSMAGDSTPYNKYLKEKGYPENIWRAGYGAFTQGPDGEAIDPGEFKSRNYPTIIKAEDSETAFMTNKAMEFITEAKQDENPWILQLNWFNPHSHFVAPEPYHKMYDPAEVPINRHPDELKDMHPLHRWMRFERDATPLDNEDYCRELRATYYGMITEIDDQVGRLREFLENEGLSDNTIIAFTSDHGEYLGDHWCREKEMWYDEAYRIPLIVHDPRSSADKTRGVQDDAWVEIIDILPTLLDASDIEVPYYIQGNSLMPMIRQGVTPADWRTEVHADFDFRCYWSSEELGLKPEQCRMWIIRDNDFKYIFFNGLPDILYDLQKDPNEFFNVADKPEYKDAVNKYREKMLIWRMSNEDNSRIGWVYKQRPKFGKNPFHFRHPWD